MRARLVLLVLTLLAASGVARAQAPERPPATPSAPGAPGAQQPLTTLPIDHGLPILVRTALGFVAIEAIDENGESFTATVDLRLIWNDPRLAFPAADAPVGYVEWRGEAAVAQLAAMWRPRLAFGNLRGSLTADSQSLRITPDGRVELLRRVTGTFGAPIDVSQFPFDRQKLPVELVSESETAAAVMLDYRQDDLAFSRPNREVSADGWEIGSIELVRDPLPGWHGESYARLRASLAVTRRAMETVPGLFVPLLASLLIPLLATWLNRANGGRFEIEAFELTNIIIGGLFAVIALNFTINSQRTNLASGVNTVSLLFALNYLALACALVVNVALYRFNLVRAVAGRHVQQEAFRFIIWAFPVAVAGSATALILLAAA